MKIPSVKIRKIIISSLLFRWCVFWLLYTITQWVWGVFFGSEPLAVSVVIRMSALVFFSSIWAVTIRWLIALRVVWLIFAWATAVWIGVSYGSLSATLSWLLKAIAWITSMILVCLLVVYKYQAYTKYRSVSSLTINFSWISMIWVWTAALCALLTSISIIKAPLTCDVVYDWYEKALESPLIPLQRSEQSLESLGEQSVFSFLTMLKDESSDNKAKVEEEKDKEIKTFEAFMPLLESEESWRWSSFQSTLMQAKHSLIDETLEQRSLVTQNVCELVLNQVNEIRKTATRNISIVVLLFVVLSPIVTLRFRFIAFLWRGAFKILMTFGWFRLRKKLVAITEIE